MKLSFSVPFVLFFKQSCWRDPVAKDLLNVRAAFDVLEDEEELPANYSKMAVHLIFDVKMDLTRKVRLVVDGHKIPDPVESTYAGVVSRESVRVSLIYASLMGIDVWGAYVQNAYISAPSTDKCIWDVAYMEEIQGLQHQNT